MRLSKLQVQHVRNLKAVMISDIGKVNVFYGPNGSGKTSLLEAIHLLGMARSFRGSSVKSLIQHSQEACTVSGAVRRAGRSSGAGIALGVQRGRNGDSRIKVGGVAVRSVAELAENFPLQVINASSFDLLVGPPLSRRQYLDWGVFHVEHTFFSVWQRFQRCIKQRNRLLQHGKIADKELAVWTRDLAESGETINQLRHDYLDALIPRVIAITEELSPPLEGLEFRFRQGWDKTISFQEALETSTRVDQERGYTHVGPQRADLRVTINGHLAADTLSRGQQKLVVCALKLAQGELMAALGGGTCCFLMDDLPSELDEEHCQRVCTRLSRMDAQVFVTCVDRNTIDPAWLGSEDFSVFHVEHGQIERRD